MVRPSDPYRQGVERVTGSPEETEALAARLARRLRAGDVVAVSGELGAGKTTFVRGAARALGVSEPISSPTFTIGHRYDAPVPVAHLDLYRVVSLNPEEWVTSSPTSTGRSRSSSGRSMAESGCRRPARRLRSTTSTKRTGR